MYKDLDGKRFGSWIVIDRADKKLINGKWLRDAVRCRCDCGIEEDVLVNNLTRGKSKSCRNCRIKKGGRKHEDLTGKKFGRWTALEFESRISKRGIIVSYWKCLCECGTIKTVETGHLKNGKSINRSCGCWKKKADRIRGLKMAAIGTARFAARRHLQVKEGTAFRTAYAHYRRAALKRGYKWELTEEQFREVTSSPCAYTGQLPAKSFIAKSGEVYMYNGIDRKDNTKGYIMENCLPCCAEVNRMKMKIPYDRFIQLCHLIASNVPPPEQAI